MRLARLLPLVALLAAGGDGRATRRTVPRPATDCMARVGYDRDQILSGYLLPTATGPRTCIPFTTVAAIPPAGYAGDFYVDAFTDERLRARWASCKTEPSCFARLSTQVAARQPPNRERSLVDPHARYLLGKVDEPAAGALDLAQVRRPAFFVSAPYREPIAALDARTTTVEFTAPPDAFERLHRGDRAPVSLRGWYIRGDGAVASGGRRALVIMTGGGGTRIAAIEDPADTLYRIEADGRTHLNAFPNATTGSPGQAVWRTLAADLVGAGFDVLLYDRRGVGVSTGFSDTNTLQQGRDILAMIAALRTGDGLRSIAADGTRRDGAPAARALRKAATAGMPVLLLGNSRGSMSSGWAMTLNFSADCTFDLPAVTCGPPRRDASIKGAMLVAEFASGAGYVSRNTSPEDEARGLGRDRGLFIAGSEVENNIVLFPSSAILAGMDRWPAVFLARGLWDYASALEGTVDAWSRVRGAKELMVVRGPHPIETWPLSERRRLTERLIAFAGAAVAGRRTVPGGRPWHDLRSLVATTSDVWERSTRPTTP